MGFYRTKNPNHKASVMITIQGASLLYVIEKDQTTMTVAQAELPRVDVNAFRVNQAAIITFLILAFVLGAEWLVLCTCLVMAIGTLVGVPGFKPFYQYVLQPLNLVKPDIEHDNPEPHRFAQGFGAFVLLLAVLALFSGSVMGWVLTWVVI